MIFPLILAFFALANGPARPVTAACEKENGGLTLPDGFCASVLARDLEGVRQVAVGSDGIVYAALAKGDGGVVALRDRDGDGQAEERKVFGPTGANDVKIHEGYLYLALPDRIVRWRLVPGELQPPGEAEVIVQGLPGDKSHRAKSIAFAGDVMYVNIGAPTNSCQAQDRTQKSPGVDPCPELQDRAGIWQFSATRPGQSPKDGTRFATGIRNATALAVRPSTADLFAATHGRDQLSTNWGFSDAYNAENPGEELLLVRQGDDFGWPYCYYSTAEQHLVLAPEYGGDGTKTGRCSPMKEPLMAFPAHWAPLALAFTEGSRLPAPYASGALLAFHGSWNRAPQPQAGYRVVFIPFADGRPTGQYSTFAIGTAGPDWLRATGVAVTADGSVYISADKQGMIWRVTREGA